LLEPANVSDHIDWVRKFHDWVANQLTWTVPSNLSAAVNVNNLCAVVWSFGILGALAGGVNTLMLKQNASIWPSALHYFFMNGSLES
jgi:hypothetical protein